MKCYNCGHTVAAARYPGLAELILARDERKNEIVKIYSEHNPSKLHLVDALLEEWVGEEAVLLIKIRSKYLPPQAESSDDDSPPAVRYKSLTTGIIREGPDPGSAKVGKLEVDEVVVALADKVLENGIVRVMCEKGWVSVTAKTGKAMMEKLPETLTHKQRKYRERIEFERQLRIGDVSAADEGSELMTMAQYSAQMEAEESDGEGA
jgi:hypothetical protein